MAILSDHWYSEVTAIFLNWYLHRIHVDASEQLMDNVRDEIASEKRPSAENPYVANDRTCTCDCALGTSLYPTAFALGHSPVEVWSVTGLTIVVCMYLVFFLTVFPWAYFLSRTRLEKYLHSLTTINALLMSCAAMAGPVYDEKTGTLSLCSLVRVRESIREWMSALISMASLLQIAEARIMAPDAVSRGRVYTLYIKTLKEDGRAYSTAISTAEPDRAQLCLSELSENRRITTLTALSCVPSASKSPTLTLATFMTRCHS
jgi:hypothetical protein